MPDNTPHVPANKTTNPAPDITQILSDFRKEILTEWSNSVNKVVGEVVERRLKDLQIPSIPPATEDGKSNDNPPAPPKSEAARLKALEDELAAANARTAKERLTNSIQAELAKFSITKSARGMVVNELSQLVKTDKAGNYVMTIKEELPTTKQIIEKEVSIDIGIQHYFKERQDLLVVVAKNGSANSGGIGGFEADVVRYEQLLQNPTLMTKYVQEKPETVNQLRSEYRQRQRDRQEEVMASRRAGGVAIVKR